MSLMRRLLLRARRDEHGFTMVTVIVALFMSTLLAGAALARSQGDIKPGQKHRDRKEALAAAEAGLNKYLFHLVQDETYWTKCATGVASYVNQRVSGSDNRQWGTIPSSTARFAIELMPANGRATCDRSDPEGTMIDTATGSFRIRVTGEDRPGGVRRSLVVNLKRRGFLDYIYFTDKETSDPEIYKVFTGDRLTRQNGTNKELAQWAREECGSRYWNDQRNDHDGNLEGGRDGLAGFRGDAPNAGIEINGAFQNYPSGSGDRKCGEIQFITGDSVNGPLHSNDELNICGSPKFGRKPTDLIEVSGPGPAPADDAQQAAFGWRQSCGSGRPNVTFKSDAQSGATFEGRGTWVPSAGKVELPPSNTKLKQDTPAAFRFKGRTVANFTNSGTSLYFTTGKREDGTDMSGQTITLPVDGSIFISNDGACDTYNPVYPATSATCGDLEIYGQYDRNITFGAENDIIITDNLTNFQTAASSKKLLGLVSNNFIRVGRQTSAYDRDLWQFAAYTCSNSTPNVDRTIEAAILSVNHSFIVDRYFCGARIGTLNVIGAIGQKYRGPVGTSFYYSAQYNGQTGYLKNYVYDDRLRYRSPPRFLDPARASWRIQTQTEQTPPT